MATFTVELRKIEGKVRDVGLSQYPIFNEHYRRVLNDRIIETYAYREIGFETIEMFVDRLAARMALIMPAYNKIYESTLIDFDPMIGTRFKTTTKSEGSENTSTSAASTTEAESTADNNSKSRSVSSDFPQMMLKENEDYASSAADSVSESTANTNAKDESRQNAAQQGETSGTSETLMEGLGAMPSQLLLSYRETIINVDRTIVGELTDLFMNVWNTGDEYGDYPQSYSGPIFTFGGY